MEMGLCMGDGLGLYMQDDIGEGVELCVQNDGKEVVCFLEMVMEMGLCMRDDDGDVSVYGR